MVSFLDYIDILERVFNDHMRNVEQILSRFLDLKLKLHPIKCKLRITGLYICHQSTAFSLCK